MTLLEYLTSASNKIVMESEVSEELKNQDKDVRILTYKILLDKFNSKYENLNENQKAVLKEFINSTDSTVKLKNFYNIKILEIKKELTKSVNKITDPVTKIKLTEVMSLLKELDKTSNITNEHLTNLLQYYELLEELTASK
jgi:hypothetical protein